MAELNIRSYVFRVSTLEEVFIEIGRKESAKYDKENDQYLQQ